MSKKKNNKEEINDFEDLKDLLLKNLSPQMPQNSSEEINHTDDLNDDFLLSAVNIGGKENIPELEYTDNSVESDWEYEENKYIKNPKASNSVKKKAKKQEEVNDFDDLKDLLLKNLNPQLSDEKNMEVNGKIDLKEVNSLLSDEIFNKEIKHEDNNDFDDLKDLLLKNLSQQKPENSNNEDPFMKDAMEGLEMIEDKSKIDQSVLSMNNNLNKILDSRKQRKKKHSLPSNQWALLAVGIVLLLAIISYFVIHLNGMTK